MDTTYEERGFKVSIIQTPAKPGIMLLNDKVIDTDVMKLKRAVVRYKNRIVVEPALATDY